MHKARYILLALALTAAAALPSAAFAKATPAPCHSNTMFDGKVATQFDGGKVATQFDGFNLQ